MYERMRPFKTARFSAGVFLRPSSTIGRNSGKHWKSAVRRVCTNLWFAVKHQPKIVQRCMNANR